MSISIAMCTYNGTRFLEEQLDSFTTQRRLPDELVVCDDRSSDDTVSIVERFALRAPFPVRLVRNPQNLGYSRNFNKALQLCEGDLIALSDQDDIWYPEKLHTLEQSMVQCPAAEGIFSDGDIIDETSKPVGRTLWKSFRFFPEAQQRFQSGGAIDELLRRNVVTGMAFMVRSSARELLRDTPPSWIHDGWLAFLIAMRSGLLACPERLVGYRVHGTQQVGTPPTHDAKIRAARTSGMRSYAARVRALNLEEYQRTQLQFSDLWHYLEQNGLGAEGLRTAVQGKEWHARRGAAALAGNRLGRLTLLAHAGAYLRFSPIGLRGLLRDLMI